MKQQKTLSIKKAALVLAFSSLLLSGAARAYYDNDDYDNGHYDDYSDAYLSLIPLILYSTLREPRVVVRKRIYREGRLIPRLSGKPHHHKKHRRSRSRDHYKYPQRNHYHSRF